MAYQYVMYRPRRENNGLAANLSVNGDRCYISVARQQPSSGENDSFSWQKKGDVHDPKKNINVKLGLADIGAILAVLNGVQPEVKLFHKFTPKDAAEITTQIIVAKYLKDNVQTGYSINILRAGEKFGWLIGFGETEIVKDLLHEAILGQTWNEIKAKE